MVALAVADSWAEIEAMRAARPRPAEVRFAAPSAMAEARAALAAELAPVLPVRPFGVTAEALAAVTGPNPFDKSKGMQRPRTMTAREWQAWKAEHPLLAWQETCSKAAARMNFTK